jgi:hypothetical protein
VGQGDGVGKQTENINNWKIIKSREKMLCVAKEGNKAAGKITRAKTLATSKHAIDEH